MGTKTTDAADRRRSNWVAQQLRGDVTMFRTSKFCDLSIGDEFRFGRNAESGLLIDVGRAGRVEYVKVSSMMWKRLDDGSVGRVGTKRAKVWVAV